MTRFSPTSSAILLPCLLALAAALPPAAVAAAPTESGALASLATGVIRPSLAELADTARKLADSSRRMCQRRDMAGLTAAQDDWRKASAAWRRSVPFQFGPAANLERRLGGPVQETVLEAAVRDDRMHHLRTGKETRGYAAVEYLLFAPAGAAAATAGGRCEHLRDVTAEIAAVTSRAEQEWDKGYGREFVAAGDGKPFLVPGDALSLILARTLNSIETVLRDGIGVPGGIFTGRPRPELFYGRRSATTREAFQATLEGLNRSLLGGGSASILNLVATRDGLVSRKNPALAAGIRRQLETIGNTIAKLDAADLGSHGGKPSRRLKRLYDGMEKLQKQLVEATLVLELDVRSATEKQ